MTGFSAFDRQTNIEKLKTETFDFLVVGGGITGAGVARDAASRGLKVGLVEARDFAFGTSSRSSKLIHGGIRYLENREFGLVFEALSERKLLFEIAPHLVHPLKFVLPVYNDFRYSMGMMGLGMWLYDFLALFDAPENHEQWGPEHTLARLPMLQAQGLQGSFAYYDAYMDDDRLTLETLRSAAAQGAVVANYASVQDAVRDSDGKIAALEILDKGTNRKFQIRAKHFIGSLGPWTDIFGNDVLHDWKRVLRPTKGVHVTLERSRLQLKEAVVMADEDKNRIVFAMPRHDMVILGTTDTDFSGDPAQVHADEADIEYILGICGEYFPGAHLTREDLVASYSGVRPLVYDGSESTGKTSREHKIWNDPRGFTFVAGGKYTTYRHMSEQIVNQALEALGPEYMARFPRSQTKTALNPMASVETLQKARGHLRAWSENFGFPLSDVEWVIERHGLEAEGLLSRANRERWKNIWQAEAWHAIHHGMCLHLEDFYLRRAPLFLGFRDHGSSIMDDVCGVFAQFLGWSEAEIKEEKAAIQRHLELEMGWRPTS